VQKKKTHGKVMFCRVFFFGTRQTIDFAVCQRKCIRQSLILLCAKNSTRQSMDLPCAFFKPGVFVVAHGKVALCRVPDKKHTVNNKTHSKFGFSGSVCGYDYMRNL